MSTAAELPVISSPMRELVLSEVENLSQLYDFGDLIPRENRIHSLNDEQLLGLYTRLVTKVAMRMVKVNVPESEEEA